MSLVIIDSNRIETWPPDVILYLQNADTVFANWKNVSSKYEEQVLAAKEFDKVIYGLKPILSSYYLHGYHCTRLTEDEINTILSNGMTLQNAETLKYRLENIVSKGQIEKEIAVQLLSYNDANGDNRKNRLWFCFFPPFIAGQRGIERLFRSWGGEALYNSHENNTCTGRVLQKIGTPCIVEAYVSIKGFDGYGFELHLVDCYLARKENRLPKISYYEGCSKINIPADKVLNVIQFSNKKFIELTKCNTWNQPL